MLKSFLKLNFHRNFLNIWQIFVRKRHQCELPSIVMNNGNEMPILGFGTWSGTSDFISLENVENKVQKPSDNENPEIAAQKVAKAVGWAIDAGYRHIDCAHLYQTQREIGEILKKKIEAGIVKREDLFITSKLWNTFHDPDNVCSACQKTLADLDLEYLDMYLMHSPMGFQYGDEAFPMCDGKLLTTDDDYLNTWQAMEELVANDMCKNIGITNFNQMQIKRLIKNSHIIPQTLQIELHPYMTQKDLIKFAKYHDICITAYAPIGSPKRPWAIAEKEERTLLSDYKILQIAEKHKRSPGQILLRYQVQCGHAVIPKSTNKKHIEDNINIFDFELSSEDMLNIENLNHNVRYFKFSGAYGHPHHPFEKPEEMNKC
ncbi:aldo-keto reductase 1B-like [Cochliomyia hominivorax]